jgi:hypothetical protein
MERDTREPIDLGPYLDGLFKRPKPSLGLARSDGLQLLYPGKEHTVIGEMGSGKSWFAAGSCAQRAGQALLILDILPRTRNSGRRATTDQGVDAARHCATSVQLRRTLRHHPRHNHLTAADESHDDRCGRPLPSPSAPSAPGSPAGCRFRPDRRRLCRAKPVTRAWRAA